MVLYVAKYTIHPDKPEGYLEWAKNAISRTLAVTGVIELRGYRVAGGSAQIAAAFEFADMADWAAWHGHADTQQVLTELRTVATGVTTELWGPSPLIPQPVRPSG